MNKVKKLLINQPKTIIRFRLRLSPNFLRFRRLKLMQHILRKLYSKILRKRVLRKKKRLRRRRAVAKKSTVLTTKNKHRVRLKATTLAAKNKHRVRLKARLIRSLITRIRRRRYSRRLGSGPWSLNKNNSSKNIKTASLYRYSNSKNVKAVPARAIHSKSRPIKHKLMFNSSVLCTPFKLFRKSKLFRCYVYRQSYRLFFMKQSVTSQLLIKTTNSITNLQSFSNLLKRSIFMPTYFSKKFIRQAKIYTTHGSPFINYKDGLVRTKKFSFKGKLTESSFLIKKKFYSFLRTNEYKKQIFDSRRKFFISKVLKLLNTYSSKFNSLNFFTNSNMRFLQKNQRIENEPYITSPEDRMHSVHSKLKVVNTNRTYRELHMQRVRFKPGYQRLWRNFRLALAELVNFRYIYQRQLTRYLIKFSRKLTQNYYSFNENDVMRVIIYTRLIPDEATFNLFHSNNLIFLNNKPLNDNKSFIYKNDFLQLEITNWYYIFSRWLMGATRKRNLRFKALVFKKSLASRYNTMKRVKQRSNHTPSWITTVRYDFADIKPFLEVDFFTLSAFCIYDYNVFTYYSPDDIRNVRFSIYRLYNWKYVN